MFVLNKNNNFFYNAQSNHLIDLNKMCYITDVVQINEYKCEFDRLSVLNEDNEGEYGFTHQGFEYGLSKAADMGEDLGKWILKFLENLIPETTEDFVHLSVDTISLILDILGPATLGATNVASFVIDIIHGAYYLAAAQGYFGLDKKDKELEYMLAGIFTIGFAFLPGYGNAQSMAVKRTISNAAKRGTLGKTVAKLVNKSPNMKAFFQGVFSKRAGGNWFTNVINTIMRKINKYNVLKWFFKKTGGSKALYYATKGIDSFITKMATKPGFQKFLKLIGSPGVDSAAKAAIKKAKKEAIEKLQKQSGSKVTKLKKLDGLPDRPIVTKADADKFITKLNDDYMKFGNSVKSAGVKKAERNVKKAQDAWKVAEKTAKEDVMLIAQKNLDKAKNQLKNAGKSLVEEVNFTRTALIKKFRQGTFGSAARDYDLQQDFVPTLRNLADETGQWMTGDDFTKTGTFKQDFIDAVKGITHMDIFPEWTVDEINNDELSEESITELQKYLKSIKHITDKELEVNGKLDKPTLVAFQTLLVLHANRSKTKKEDKEKVLNTFDKLLEAEQDIIQQGLSKRLKEITNLKLYKESIIIKFEDFNRLN